MHILLNLIILTVVVFVGIIVYDKLVHPILFKEELEDTLEDAVEKKTRKTVQKKAKEILEETDDSTT